MPAARPRCWMLLSLWLLCLSLRTASAAPGPLEVQPYVLEDADDPDLIPPTCDSQIYCQGQLLETVQLARLFDDSKTFVDMKQLQDPEETLANFERFMSENNGKPSQEAVRRFVNDNFEQGGQLVNWTLPDWHESPALLSQVADPKLREWAAFLNEQWPMLSRRIPDEVRQQPDRYSLLYVPNGFVVPGGRFQEYYYWDTYWVLQGLLATDMPETARGVLGNLIYLVQTLGHIPNGGRVYYEQRAQPPLLVPMVESLVRYCQAAACDYRLLLGGSIDALDQEFAFWVSNRTVQVGRYKLARYFAPSRGPRPESYREDYITAHVASDPKQQQSIYNDLKSAAESGWDFSSRWFIKNGTNEGNVSNTHTRYIIPVDLNAFLCMNARILYEFHSALGNIAKANYYKIKMDEFMEAVDAVLWNTEEGVWLDYDMLNNKSRNYFYSSNLTPLFAKCHKKSRKDIRSIVSYLRDNNIETYLGGAPVSLYRSGEQWDYPNVWPPVESMLIMGLKNTGVPEATKYAYKLAQIWVNSTYTGYIRYSAMFEKYDAERPGDFGYGGEYVVQPGFGWTNGGILEILKEYGQNLTVDEAFKHSSSTSKTAASQPGSISTNPVPEAIFTNPPSSSAPSVAVTSILSFSKTAFSICQWGLLATMEIKFILVCLVMYMSVT